MENREQPKGASASASSLTLTNLSSITVLVGHAGVGKTNTAMGLAIAQADAGHEVTLVDLDIVNPYFRSSDYPELLSEHGVHLVSPVLARTTLDTPSLSGEVDTVLESAGRSDDIRVIVDVGGDDDGATALGRYAEKLDSSVARVFYVVSAFRSLTLTAGDAAEMLPEIEWHAHLRADGVVNTSNIAEATTISNVRHGREFAKETAELLGLPLVATVVPLCTVENAVPITGDAQSAEEAYERVESLLTEGEPEHEQIIVMPRFVTTPWN